jgi:hypothetical protein
MVDVTFFEHGRHRADTLMLAALHRIEQKADDIMSALTDSPGPGRLAVWSNGNSFSNGQGMGLRAGRTEPWPVRLLRPWQDRGPM